MTTVVGTMLVLMMVSKLMHIVQESERESPRAAKVYARSQTGKPHCQGTIIIFSFTIFLTRDITRVNNISHQMNLQYDRLYVDGRCYGWSQTQGRVLEQAVGSVFVNLLFLSVSCFCQYSVFVNLLFL